MRWLVATAAVLALWAVSLGARADSAPPPPTQWVTDNVGFISDATRDSLNSRLRAYEQATGHQVLVWIGDTTGGAPLEDWTTQAFSTWKVGRKGLVDGLVLFIFASDHTVRIEVGYGLEDKVPDVIASRIIRDAIVPLIRSGDHDAAVMQGVSAVLDAIGGEQLGASPQPQASPAAGVGDALLFLFIALLVILFIARSGPWAGLAGYMIGSSRGFWGGGSSFGGGGFGGGGFSGGGGMGGGGGASGGW